MNDPLELQTQGLEAHRTAPGAPPLRVRRGSCYMLFVYDVAHAIDLERCQGLLKDASQPVRFQHRQHGPHHFQFRPEPIRVLRETLPRQVGAWTVRATVELVIYDFGAVSVMYTLPLNGSLETIIELSGALCGDEALAADSARHIDDLLQFIRAATSRPGASGLVEDYLVFEFEEFETPLATETLRTAHAQDLARLLRSESDILSAQEVADSLGRWASFSPNDLTVIDWNAALIVDSSGEDVRAVLEFANVQLLEMRFLDRQIDDDLDRAYDLIAKRSWWQELGPWHKDLRRVGQAQVDSAILFEEVFNALKLLGDQYLARVYRLASERFYLQEWNAGILRKLNALESIYEKLNDRSANQRLEALEWIIIVLIAISIILPFITGGH